MNTIRKVLLQGTLLLFISLILSCGGGGGGSTMDGTGGPPQQRDNSYFIGTLSNENDVIAVNGVEFESDESNVIIDGETVGEGDTSRLATGQVVIINGTLSEDGSTATATTISYNSLVIGPVESINEASGSLVILGQTVLINDDVRYGGLASSVNDLAVNDVIQVSGFVRANSDITATRLDKLNPTGYEVTGSISNLDTIENTFDINGLTVNFSAITPPAEIAENIVVEVKGNELNNNGHLMATSISIIELTFSDGIEVIEIEGLITEFTDEFSFAINGIDIETDRQTVYLGGSANDLTLNSKIEVEGTLGNDDTVIAERIIFLTAAISNFNRGDRISSSTEVFTWPDVGADEYRLRVMSVAGIGDRVIAHDEYYTGDTLSATVTGLPENEALFDVVLSTRHDAWWSQRTVRLRGQGLYALADLISPQGGDVLESETVTFTWSDVDADEYRLVINNNRNRLFDQSVDGNTLSITVDNLPSNRAYLAPILMSRHGRWWSSQDYRMYSYDALPNARFTSHAHKDVLTSDTETFTWHDVGADGYRVGIQSLSGFGRTFYSEEFDGDATSVTINGLPLNSARLAVRLYTNHGGFWNQLDYEMFGAGTLPDAELTSHANLEQLNATETQLSWTEIPDAEQYRVMVRAVYSDGGDRRIIHNDDYDSHITSLSLSNLPRNGAPFDVMIRTHQQGWWGLQSYRLRGMQTLDNALLTSHSDSDVLTSDTVELRWSDVDADEYRVRVYTSAGNRLLDEVYEGQTTSTIVSALPRDGSTVYIELTTNHDNWWAQARGRYQLTSN